MCFHFWREILVKKNRKGGARHDRWILDEMCLEVRYLWYGVWKVATSSKRSWGLVFNKSRPARDRSSQPCLLRAGKDSLPLRRYFFYMETATRFPPLTGQTCSTRALHNQTRLNRDNWVWLASGGFLRYITVTFEPNKAMWANLWYRLRLCHMHLIRAEWQLRM